MAEKAPFSELMNISCDRDVKSPSGSSAEFSSISSTEYASDMLPTSITSNKIKCSSEEISQLQEKYMLTVEQCLTKLKREKRNNEEMLINVKKSIQDKMSQMLHSVKQSFEDMHEENNKHIQQKCQEIGRVLSRVGKMVEERSREISYEVSTSNETLKNKKLIEDTLKRKCKIEAEVEIILEKLSIKKDNDERIYRDFKEEVQEMTKVALLTAQNGLDLWAEEEKILVEKKVKEFQKTLENLQLHSKFS